jgi:hypothetical protein
MPWHTSFETVDVFRIENATVVQSIWPINEAILELQIVSQEKMTFRFKRRLQTAITISHK